MKVDVSQVLMSFRKEDGPLKSDGKDMTLEMAATNALLVQAQNDHAEGTEKYRRYKLATRIMTEGPVVELSVEEAALIKKLVGAIYLPTVVGRVFEALEGP